MQMKPCLIRHRRPMPGFTLTELLVVILIIVKVISSSRCSSSSSNEVL
jgi:prepilin-type N-terminal cleavage/methylation domain-containing protein